MNSSSWGQVQFLFFLRSSHFEISLTNVIQQIKKTCGLTQDSRYTMYRSFRGTSSSHISCCIKVPNVEAPFWDSTVP